MKTTNRLATMIAIAALSFGTVANVRAADAEGKAKVGSAEGKASVNVKKDYDTTRSSTSDRYTASDKTMGVTDIHKASKLTGMKVKNEAGETLGNIEDLVVDMKTGKISYAVLGVGGFLGIGEKYIAVPPSAFRIGDDDKSLVLNADKAKLEAAPGFAKTNWPDYRNPNFGGEAFWTTDTGVGGSANISTSGKSSSTLDHDRKYDRDLNNSKDRSSSSSTK